MTGTRRRLSEHQKTRLAFEVLQLVEAGWAVSLAVSKVAYQHGISNRASWRIWTALPLETKLLSDVATRLKGANTANKDKDRRYLDNQRGASVELHPALRQWIEDHLALGIEDSKEKLFGRMIMDWKDAEVYLPSRSKFLKLAAEIETSPSAKKRGPNW